MFYYLIVYISKTVYQHFQKGNELSLNQLSLYSWSQITYIAYAVYFGQ